MAKDRPQKRPTTLAHEDGWRQELADAGYDPDRIKPTTRPSRGADPPSPDDLQVVTIASRALDRCASQASTWTRHSVAEHATRVVTEHGVRGTPADLRDLVEVATDLAVGDCLSVLPPGAARPEHVAHLTSLDVVAAETRLRDLLAERPTTGRESAHPDVTRWASQKGLDDAQARAAAAVASTNSLVIVEGAAGAGKTTMLAVAIEAAAAEGRATRILTPTKKAADVATSELGVPAESVAKLLHAHGWRWNCDGVWSRLALGDPDPDTGREYGGVPPWARLGGGERVVVDEAGMLDQDSAIALLTVTAEVGAPVALVGDRAQLPAVGRGGVLDMAACLTTGSGGTVYDMDSVHRFTDPAYADLTLRLRAGHEPERIFDRLHALGLVRLHSSAEDARADIAASATSAIEGKDSVAVTVATNDEARALNELIRVQRVARAEVDDTTTVAGSDGLPIGRGDVITTRKNNGALGVANRQAWTVQGVGSDGTVWAVENNSTLKHRRSVALPSSYVSEHVHLGYAATAYGVQGVTTTTSHTQVSEALDAAGVYVGMTRGRDLNVLHIVAENLDEAREQFICALQLDRADRGLQMATADAQAAVAGLAADGPVKLINDERARLVTVIAAAEREAARWERAAGLLSAQAESHAHEEAAALATLTAAEAHLTSVQSEAMRSLLPLAIADGQSYIDAHEHQAAARRELNSVGRLGRRAANRRLEAVNDEAHDAQERALERWRSLPSPSKWDAGTRDGLDAWAKRVASERAESQPLMSAALQQVEQGGEQLRQVRWRHLRESADLRLQVYGRDAPTRRATPGALSPKARADYWRNHAEAARAELAQIESLPIGRAVQFIEAGRVQALKREHAAANRRSRLDLSEERRLGRPDPAPGLGL